MCCGLEVDKQYFKILYFFVNLNVFLVSNIRYYIILFYFDYNIEQIITIEQNLKNFLYNIIPFFLHFWIDLIK